MRYMLEPVNLNLINHQLISSYIPDIQSITL